MELEGLPSKDEQIIGLLTTVVLFAEVIGKLVQRELVSDVTVNQLMAECGSPIYQSTVIRRHARRFGIPEARRGEVVAYALEKANTIVFPGLKEDK